MPLFSHLHAFRAEKLRRIKSPPSVTQKVIKPLQVTMLIEEVFTLHSMTIEDIGHGTECALPLLQPQTIYFSSDTSSDQIPSGQVTVNVDESPLGEGCSSRPSHDATRRLPLSHAPRTLAEQAWQFKIHAICNYNINFCDNIIIFIVQNYKYYC